MKTYDATNAKIYINGKRYEQPPPIDERPAQTTKLTRQQRRAWEARTRRFNRHLVGHLPHCVVNKDLAQADIMLELGRVEHHKIHVARGEPVCQSCLICEQQKIQGQPPTRFSAHEREALLRQWREAIALHQRVRDTHVEVGVFLGAWARLVGAA